MIFEANQIALQAAALSYILCARIPFLSDVVREWRNQHPDEALASHPIGIAGASQRKLPHW
jgi:hypothetical protein